MTSLRLYAPDPVGKAAHEAAMLVSRLDLWLRDAASPTLDDHRRAESLALVLRQWPKIHRAMVALERTAPNIFRQWEDDDGPT